MQVEQIAHVYGSDRRPMSVRSAVEYEVQRAGNDSEDQIRSLRAQVEKLAEFVGAAMEALPPREAVTILKTVGYGWEVAP